MDNLPVEFQYNGKILRYGRKNKLWAVGYEWAYKNNVYRLAHYGDWSQGSHHIWKSYDGPSNGNGFKKKEKEVIDNIKLTVDAEKEKKHKECADFWKEEWSKLPDGPIHPYLEKKGIQDIHGTKTDQFGTLIIKIINKEGIVGVQKIYQHEDKWEKRYSTGIRKKGSFAYIGEYDSAEYLYVCEGFATGASIFEHKGIPVIIALDCGNLFDAIITIRKVNPKCKIIICADNDKNKIGIKKAKYCESSFLNVITKSPSFTLKSDELTDFNDLACSEGIGDQVDFSEGDFLKIIPLGHNDGNYFYTSSINSQIVKIPSSGHNDKNLFQLAPFEYWKKIKSDGDKINWTIISSELMDKCHKEGIFNPEKIRGRGVWLDKKEFVINDGKNPPKSQSFHYQKNIPIDLNTENPYSDQEMIEILEFFKKILFKNPNDYIFLSAWVIQAQIFACLPWRFHLWLTGERGTGKSTLLEWIGEMILLSITSNNATAAGITQTIKNDCVALLLDEVEPDSSNGQGLIEMARHFSSNNGFTKLRGTPGGKAISSSGQGVMLFGSIQPGKFTGADISRIYVAELEKTKGRQTNDEYMSIRRGLKSVQARRLFARAYQCLPSIRESFAVAKTYLTNNLSIESRLAEQLSTALACHHVFHSTNPMEELDAANYIEDFQLLRSEFIEDNKSTDMDTCFEDLMNIKVDYNPAITLSAAIEKYGNGTLDQRKYLNEIIGLFGLRYFDDTGELFVPSKNKRLLKEMGHYTNLSTLLRRDKERCVKLNDVTRVFGIPIRGVRVMVTKIVIVDN